MGGADLRMSGLGFDPRGPGPPACQGLLVQVGAISGVAGLALPEDPPGMVAINERLATQARVRPALPAKPGSAPPSPDSGGGGPRGEPRGHRGTLLQGTARWKGNERVAGAGSVGQPGTQLIIKSLEVGVPSNGPPPLGSPWRNPSIPFRNLAHQGCPMTRTRPAAINFSRFARYVVTLLWPLAQPLTVPASASAPPGKGQVKTALKATLGKQTPMSREPAVALPWRCVSRSSGIFPPSMP